MKSWVLILPGLAEQPGNLTPLRESLRSLPYLAELGTVFRLRTMPPTETREACWLGLRPDEAQLRQGPLTVSALGKDPPERSTHFHVSPMSLADGHLADPGPMPAPDDLRRLLRDVPKLNTPRLTFLEGEAADHGLVFESRVDMRTASPPEAVAGPMRSHLPDGDGDVPLRQWIDDSVNLLAEHEVNQIRIEEGLSPVNILWPWGHGERDRVPNLALRRGSVFQVDSDSLRLAGLARLVGFRHGDRAGWGRGAATQIGRLRPSILGRDDTISVLSTFEQLDTETQAEERRWVLRRLDDEVLSVLRDELMKEPFRVLILATGPEGGVGLEIGPGVEPTAFPMDERTQEEKTARMRTVWDAIAELGA